MVARKGLRPNKIKIFNGKKYERAGQEPSKSKRELQSWAKFQRDVNDRNVRIVKVDGGWEAYISVARRK